MKVVSYLRYEKVVYAPYFNRQKLSVEQVRTIQRQTQFCTEEQLDYWLESVLPSETLGYSYDKYLKIPADWVFTIFLDYQIDKIENAIKKQLSE